MSRGLGDVYKRQIHLVNSSDIPGIENRTSISLDHSYVTALGLLRVALDTLVGMPDDGGIKGKIAKLLQN